MLDMIRDNNQEPLPPAAENVSTQEDEESDDDDEEPLTSRQKFRKRAWAFYNQNEFLILVVIAICLARAYPPLGAVYLKPKITAGWLAVIIIFCKFRLARMFTSISINERLTHNCCPSTVMAGLALRTEEFVKAFQQIYFNAFVQLFNFGFISVCVFGFSRLMVTLGAISQELGNGMAICGCLPITVNMCVVLTKAAGGGKDQKSWLPASLRFKVGWRFLTRIL